MYKRTSKIQDRREYGEELPKQVSMVRMAHIHGDDIYDMDDWLRDLRKRQYRSWKHHRKHQWRN